VCHCHVNVIEHCCVHVATRSVSVLLQLMPFATQAYDTLDAAARTLPALLPDRGRGRLQQHMRSKVPSQDRAGQRHARQAACKVRRTPLQRLYLFSVCTHIRH
jgi:hypothetical protein